MEKLETINFHDIGQLKFVYMFFKRIDLMLEYGYLLYPLLRYWVNEFVTKAASTQLDLSLK